MTRREKLAKHLTLAEDASTPQSSSQLQEASHSRFPSEYLAGSLLEDSYLTEGQLPGVAGVRVLGGAGKENCSATNLAKNEVAVELGEAGDYFYVLRLSNGTTAGEVKNALRDQLGWRAAGEGVLGYTGGPGQWEKLTFEGERVLPLLKSVAGYARWSRGPGSWPRLGFRKT